MGVVQVLIVEDDPVMAMHLEALVAQELEATVVVAGSLAEAEAAARLPVDLALLDVDLPDGTTYAFATRLQSRDVPFAFVSASVRAAMPEGLRGAPFLAKPYLDRDVVGLLHELRAPADGRS